MRQRKPGGMLIFLGGIVILAFILGIVGGFAFRRPSSRLTEVSLEKIPLRTIPCASGMANLDCYQAYYASLTSEQGTGYALSDLSTRYEADSFVRDKCHTFAHAIGRSGAKAVGNVADAFADIKNNFITYKNQLRNFSLAEKVMKDINQQYKSGLVKMSDVINANTDLQTAQNNFVTALINIKQAELNLKKAQGNLLK